MSVIAIIPARKGSTRLPGKNTKMLCGKPMIEYTIQNTIDSFHIDTAIITSDDNQVKQIWQKHRDNPAVDIRFHRRPKHLRGSDVPMIDVLKDVVDSYPSMIFEEDIIVLLEPTAPLRTRDDIDRCITAYEFGFFSSVFTVCKTSPWTLKLNGAVFVTNKDMINKGKLHDEDAGLIIMPYNRSIDVDTIEDFKLAEYFLNDNNI